MYYIRRLSYVRNIFNKPHRFKISDNITKLFQPIRKQLLK